MRNELPWAVCLMGPTASGKTALAVELARRLPFGIISVDSAMVYRKLDIGSGKPTPETLAVARHRLIDIRDPWETYSAGEFASDARAAIHQVCAAGLVPLLVGGTMLYFRSLLAGLAELPQSDAGIRAGIDRQAAAAGWPAMHADLALVDPVAAARIGANDRQRIQRALEVYALTGHTISSLQSGPRPAGVANFLRIDLLPPDRAWLHARIERRLDHMLADGFVAEVADLMSLPLMNIGRPAMRAVGYRQLWQHLAGEYDSVEARQRVLAATRQLARRQLTWLRAERADYQLEAGGTDLLDTASQLLRASPAAGALSAPSG